MPSYKIVGARHHPPAPNILSAISRGTTLFLRAEPENPYDPNAIMVILKTADVLAQDKENLETDLRLNGMDLEDFLIRKEWHLGYIPKGLAAILKQENVVTNDGEVQGEFAVGFSGEYEIEIN